MIPFKLCPICNVKLIVFLNYAACNNGDWHFQQFYHLFHIVKIQNSENIDYTKINGFFFRINEFKIQINSNIINVYSEKNKSILDFPKLEKFYNLIKNIIIYL